LPTSVIDRPKLGFGGPVRQWVDGPLQEQVRDRFGRVVVPRPGWPRLTSGDPPIACGTARSRSKGVDPCNSVVSSHSNVGFDGTLRIWWCVDAGCHARISVRSRLSGAGQRVRPTCVRIGLPSMPSVFPV
jgi:hypothetical protein